MNNYYSTLLLIISDECNHNGVLILFGGLIGGLALNLPPMLLDLKWINIPELEFCGQEITYNNSRA